MNWFRTERIKKPKEPSMTPRRGSMTTRDIVTGKEEKEVGRG